MLLSHRDPTKDTITLRVKDVDPNGFANFKLIYDELLQRRQGYYDHRINIWPGQVSWALFFKTWDSFVI